MFKKLSLVLVCILNLIFPGCGKSDDGGATGPNVTGWLGVPVIVDAELNYVETDNNSKKVLFNSLIRIATTDSSELPLDHRLNRIELRIDNVTYNVKPTDSFPLTYAEHPDSIIIFIACNSLVFNAKATTASIRFEFEEEDGTETVIISNNHTLDDIQFNSYLKYNGGTFEGVEMVESVNQFQHSYIYSGDDYSLFSSAIATILTFYYGDEHTERDVINGMFQYGDREAIRANQAFSLSDAKSFLKKIGYDAAGYSKDSPVDYQWFNDYQEFVLPFIAPVIIYNRGLYSVVKGFDDQYVYMSISSMGNIAMTFEEFDNCFGDHLFLFRLAE